MVLIISTDRLCGVCGGQGAKKATKVPKTEREALRASNSPPEPLPWGDTCTCIARLKFGL